VAEDEHVMCYNQIIYIPDSFLLLRSLRPKQVEVSAWKLTFFTRKYLNHVHGGVCSNGNLDMLPSVEF
jgi:hypothetical protein